MLIVPRQWIPTNQRMIIDVPGKLLFLEVVNDTSDAITFAAYDLNGVCVIPNQQIGPGGMLTYESQLGAPIHGLAWVASAPGLAGWVKGDTQM